MKCINKNKSSYVFENECCRLCLIFHVWLLLWVWESIPIVCMRLEKLQFRIGAWTVKWWKKLLRKTFGLRWGNQLLEWFWSWNSWIIFGLQKQCTIFLPINWQLMYSSHEIWSLIECMPMRFSLCEFGEITGLDCEAFDKQDV